jgi:hypothetical protein
VENLSANQATWEDKVFIKSTFPDFYRRIMWPNPDSSGQGSSGMAGLNGTTAWRDRRRTWRTSLHTDSASMAGMKGQESPES